MIPFVLLFTALAVGLVEFLSRREGLRHLQVHFRLDTDLVEPGETATLRYTVQNAGRFPLLYAGLTLSLDGAFSLREDKAFLDRYVTEDFTGIRVDHRFFLGSGRRFSGRLRFSLPKRGLYDLGRYYLEAGDFLGLKPALRSGEIGGRVICTAPVRALPPLQALGGTVGAVSVRRFLFDDPCMVLGYRPYSGREPMKQIAWKQTAKAGSLIVRQNDFTADFSAEVLVNMDPTRPALMERCLSWTASVCRELEKRKVPYSLRSNGDLRDVPLGLGTGHLFLIQKRLGLSGLTGYTGFTLLLEDCLRLGREACTRIIITPVLDNSIRRAVDRLERHADFKPLVLCAEEDGE